MMGHAAKRMKILKLEGDEAEIEYVYLESSKVLSTQ